MFKCADCKDADCANVGMDFVACDDYTGEADMAEEEQYTEHELDDELANLYTAISSLKLKVDELEGRFNRIVAAIVKAAGPDEER